MKILAITSRYPPYHFGGYEIRGKNIIDELSRRGYEILVITSQKEKDSKSLHQADKYPVLRRLVVRTRIRSVIDQLTRWRTSHLVGMLLTFLREIFFDLQDMSFIERRIRQFQPDVIYLGHITIFSKALMPYLAACKIPMVYDEGGSGLIDSWMERGIWYKFVEEYTSRYSLLNSLKSLIIKIVSRISGNRIKPCWDWPANMQIIFNSELNRKNAVAHGVPIVGSQVIHSGIDTEKFTFIPKTRFGSPLLLIVPGRIEPRKGQLDAVRLLAILWEQGMDAKLLLVGEKWVNSYYMDVLREIRELCLEDRINIFPMITHEKLVELYHQSDICFFPSYYRTGFSRVPLEAMACGCMVISYGNEGSDEIIRDTHTGYLVSPADLPAPANIIKELIAKPVQVKEITDTARREIEAKYSMGNYVDSIEKLIISSARAH